MEKRIYFNLIFALLIFAVVAGSVIAATEEAQPIKIAVPDGLTYSPASEGSSFHSVENIRGDIGGEVFGVGSARFVLPRGSKVEFTQEDSGEIGLVSNGRMDVLTNDGNNYRDLNDATVRIDANGELVFAKYTPASTDSSCTFTSSNGKSLGLTFEDVPEGETRANIPELLDSNEIEFDRERGILRVNLPTASSDSHIEITSGTPTTGFREIAHDGTRGKRFFANVNFNPDGEILLADLSYSANYRDKGQLFMSNEQGVGFSVGNLEHLPLNDRKIEHGVLISEPSISVARDNQHISGENRYGEMQFEVFGQMQIENINDRYDRYTGSSPDSYIRYDLGGSDYYTTKGDFNIETSVPAWFSFGGLIRNKGNFGYENGELYITPPVDFKHPMTITRSDSEKKITIPANEHGKILEYTWKNRDGETKEINLVSDDYPLGATIQRRADLALSKTFEVLGAPVEVVGIGTESLGKLVLPKGAHSSLEHLSAVLSTPAESSRKLNAEIHSSMPFDPFD